MGKSIGRSHLHSLIDSRLLQSFKILAAKQDKRLNCFLEEAIKDILNKYREQCVAKTTSLIMQQKRRRYARVESSLPVRMLTSQGMIQGRMKNISKGGALINCSELPKTDSKFRLQIDLMNHSPTRAIIVEKTRLNLDESDSSLYSYDLAVRFIDTNDRAITALLNKTRGKLFLRPEARTEKVPDLLKDQSA